MKNHFKLATLSVALLSLNESNASSEADALTHTLNAKESKQMEHLEKKEVHNPDDLSKKVEEQQSKTNSNTDDNEHRSQVMRLCVLLDSVVMRF